MLLTSDKNRCLLENMRRIVNNYNVIKYWAKLGVNIKLNDQYWKWKFNTATPSLSDVCKHILYTWVKLAHPSKFEYKMEMIPGKWECKFALMMSSISKKEFLFETRYQSKEFNIDYNYLYSKYNGDKLFANVDIFKAYFDKFYNIYANEEYKVKELKKDTFKDEVKAYCKL